MTVNALPPCMKCTRLEEIVYLCCFSSSSKSRTLDPSSTEPARETAPALKSIRSASVVFPAAPWPTSATLRTSSTCVLAIVLHRLLAQSGWSRCATEPMPKGETVILRRRGDFRHEALEFRLQPAPFDRRGEMNSLTRK